MAGSLSGKGYGPFSTSYDGLTDLPELEGTCPGGLPWDCCHADECGVDDDGESCNLQVQ